MRLAFRARLAAGEIALGCNVRFSRSAEIGPMLSSCGYHWLMLDYEHSPAAPHLAYDIALAAIRAGVLPVARPSSHDAAEIASVLTNGALGILAPHVDTPEQAAAIARAARFAPIGALGVPGTMPHFGYELSLVESCARFNDEVVVVAMIESRLAVSYAAAIAATPGIDGVFIGASDLLWEMGLPGRYDCAELSDAVAQVARGARAAGRFCGIGGPKDDAVWRDFLAAGMRMILTVNDLAMLLRGARDRASYFASLAS